MIRASTRTEKASPKPNSLRTCWSPSMNDPNTRIMMPAAAAMIGPLLAWPVVTAWWLRLDARLASPTRPPGLVWWRWRHSSWIRRHQVDLVVHGQAEEDREHEHGDEGVDRPGPRQAEDRFSPAPVEHRVHGPEGGADRQQVHDRGHQGDQQAAEHGGKEQEGEDDDHGDEQGEFAGQHVGEVDVGGA